MGPAIDPLYAKRREFVSIRRLGKGGDIGSYSVLFLSHWRYELMIAFALRDLAFVEIRVAILLSRSGENDRWIE